MKIARHIFALGVACVAGILIPVLATLYDALCRYQGHATAAWSDFEWRSRFLQAATFIAEGSVFVGLAAGGLGIWYLRWRRHTALSHYALLGAGIGAVCGALFTGITHHPSDPQVVWLIFIILASISMALGFACYWFTYARRYAA